MPNSFDPSWSTGPMGPGPFLLFSENTLASDAGQSLALVFGFESGGSVFSMPGALVQISTLVPSFIRPYGTDRSAAGTAQVFAALEIDVTATSAPRLTGTLTATAPGNLHPAGTYSSFAAGATLSSSIPQINPPALAAADASGMPSATAFTNVYPYDTATGNVYPLQRVYLIIPPAGGTLPPDIITIILTLLGLLPPDINVISAVLPDDTPARDAYGMPGTGTTVSVPAAPGISAAATPVLTAIPAVFVPDTATRFAAGPIGATSRISLPAGSDSARSAAPVLAVSTELDLAAAQALLRAESPSLTSTVSVPDAGSLFGSGNLVVTPSTQIIVEAGPSQFFAEAPRITQGVFPPSFAARQDAPAPLLTSTVIFVPATTAIPDVPGVLTVTTNIVYPAPAASAHRSSIVDTHPRYLLLAATPSLADAEAPGFTTFATPSGTSSLFAAAIPDFVTFTAPASAPSLFASAPPAAQEINYANVASAAAPEAGAGIFFAGTLLHLPATPALPGVFSLFATQALEVRPPSCDAPFLRGSVRVIIIPAPIFCPVHDRVRFGFRQHDRTSFEYTVRVQARFAFQTPRTVDFKSGARDRENLAHRIRDVVNC